MMDIALAIEGLLPAAQFGGSLTANTKAAYDALRWEDERPKPSWAQLTAWWTDNGNRIAEEQAAEELIAEESRQVVKELAVDRLKNAGRLPSGFKLKE